MINNHLDATLQTPRCARFHPNIIIMHHRILKRCKCEMVGTHFADYHEFQLRSRSYQRLSIFVAVMDYTLPIIQCRSFFFSFHLLEFTLRNPLDMEHSCFKLSSCRTVHTNEQCCSIKISTNQLLIFLCSWTGEVDL